MNCTKDNNQEGKPIVDPIEKVLKPTSIVVKQGNEVLKDIVKDNKILLEEGKQYNIEVIFDEDVELQKGEFLKMKTKNQREFYADFYGKNANEINEKVVFKKQGYQDFVLEIVQEQLIAKFYKTFKSLSAPQNNLIVPNPDKKTITILNVNKNNTNAQMELTFLTPVFMENLVENNQEFIKVEKMGEGDVYKIIVSSDKLIEKEELILPIYSINKMQKGTQVSELVFKADKAPYYFDKEESSSKLNVYRYSSFSFDDGEDDEDDSEDDEDIKTDTILNAELQLYLNGEKTAYIFIDNPNIDLVESYTMDTTKKGKINITLKDGIQNLPPKTLHFFDAYEGELVGGQIVKKQNAPKQEISIYLTGY
ncbi:hypothetical protein RCZ15_10780 [Capnocytophaga catalasegens]|uniref:Lipoprotein n=2 Tax=Capnocytophaga catalasegens TaxID=1004260 RepID=A0AAV5AU46_9FLAO|nr:hypothetical protein RCZ03_17170 [Capnocytophaga catalasegens]GJM50104.1 hypothetical protein RCZ15_10780 [Capnocytophaga catalasegens]GJM53071.1 hypothetical protein RCZ16_13880 [Capnocytophaga catalasegens]